MEVVMARKSDKQKSPYTSAESTTPKGNALILIVANSARKASKLWKVIETRKDGE